jgi:acyl-coenzyme A synthetase/AMP-(fatty) acid ligase
LPSDGGSLWESLSARGAPSGRLFGTRGVVALADLAHASSLGGRLEELRGRSVLLATKDQLTAALALLELDGVARRLVLCAPDLPAQHLPGVIGGADVDACARDAGSLSEAEIGVDLSITVQPELAPAMAARRGNLATEWILLTSGTTGAPKLVLHTLASLTSVLVGQRPPPDPIVWSTFYDIRRYGGLQIFLRAVHAGSLVLSDPTEAVGDFLSRAAAAGVTHISGTPSHWRKALMSGLTSRIAPRYVRLSGEIADQPVLDGLRAAYPQAIVAHAFASTEAGVAFEVRDGRAGFPRELVATAGAGIELRVPDETLQIRSAGTATRYLGEGAETLRGADGFVDTGDRVEERDGRYYFAGRRGGVINVGGLKVHPEEVEAVINAHPWVRMSLVRARRNPITGAIVAADVVLKDASDAMSPRPPSAELVRELTESCRHTLAAHKVPALIRIVPTLEISAAGKLVRPLA